MEDIFDDCFTAFVYENRKKKVKLICDQKAFKIELSL